MDNIAIARRIGAFALGVVVCYFSRYAFSKFKEVNAKSLSAVLGCLLLGTAVTQLVSHLFFDEIALAVYPVGLFVGLCLYPFMAPPVEAIANVQPEPPAKGVRSKLLALLNRPPEAKCRIFVFGLSRTGKTVLIQQILRAMPPMVPSSTKDFLLYSGSLELEYENKTRVDVVVSDYRGQRVSQVLQDPPTVFFGPPGARLINILIFLVDCVPEFEDPGGRILSDREIVDRYAKGAKKKIMDRLAQHMDYVSNPVVEMAFRASFSKNLFAVRLLMNKVDLLEQFAVKGYLDGVGADDVGSYVEKIIRPIAARVESACASNGIADYGTGVLSAKKGSNVKEIMGPLFASYFYRFGPRK